MATFRTYQSDEEREIAELAERVFVAAMATENGMSPEASFKAAEMFTRFRDYRFSQTEGEELPNGG